MKWSFINSTVFWSFLLDGLSAMRCRIDAIGYRRCLTLVQSCKQPRFPDSLQGPPHKWALTTQLCIDEKTVMPNYLPHVHMLSKVSSPVVDSADDHERRERTQGIPQGFSLSSHRAQLCSHLWVVSQLWSPSCKRP
jgi:hypothetical protein